MSYQNPKFKTIEPAQGGGFWLVVHGTYGRSSVLAGQDYAQKTVCYDTLEQATAENPDAEVLDHPTGDPFKFLDDSPLGPAPEPWFDEGYAGEHWSEDDY